MKKSPYWIEGQWEGRLGILPRPRGGDWLEGDVRLWKQSGVDVVVSLLTPQENSHLNVDQEAQICQENGIRFFSFPVEDRGVPSSQKAMLSLLESLRNALTRGENVGIHCRQGVGRSPLVAVSLLIQSGCDPEVAIQAVSRARGEAVPETPDQKKWIIGFIPELSIRKE